MNFYNFFLITERQGRISVANVFASDANEGKLELFTQLDCVVAVLQFLHKLSQLGKLSIEKEEKKAKINS